MRVGGDQRGDAVARAARPRRHDPERRRLRRRGWVSSGSRRSGSASRTPGASSDERDPRPFIQALADSGLDVVARFLGDFRDVDREWAAGLGLGDRLELLPYATRAESLALQRDSEALLLLIPDAGGRGKGVLSGKVFEYVAVGRPILASVPLDGAAAELIRDTGAGLVAPPDDPGAIREALEELHSRWRDGRLPDVDLGAEWRDRLSRRTRVEEMAALLQEVAAS